MVTIWNSSLIIILRLLDEICMLSGPADADLSENKKTCQRPKALTGLI